MLLEKWLRLKESSVLFISENEVKSITGYLREHYKNELPDDINLGDGVVSSNGSIFAQGVDDDKDELFA